MSARPRPLPVLGATSLALLMLAACAPEPSAGPTPSQSPSPPASASASPDASPSPSPSPTAVALPTDCVELLPDAVREQLADVPLNDPANGTATGPQPDGSLVCLWREPAADTTFLETTVSRVARGTALDLMNRLVEEEGFTCYTPAGGTRCEKTWIDEQYPVQDGRTLFWRDDVLIDTSYSNLAPSGYTDGIVARLFG